MRYRERLLVHWTGGDLTGHPIHPNDTERDLLVERLKSILLNGIWLTQEGSGSDGYQLKGGKAGDERELRPQNHFRKPIGKDGTEDERAAIPHAARNYRACFTEIPIQSAIHHARRYGAVGVAVDRGVILDRWGAPVHYVRNHLREAIVWQHSRIQALFGELCDDFDDFDDREISEKVEQARKAHRYLLNFVKEMSEPDQDDFKYLEEREWRVVWTRSKTTEDTSELFESTCDEKRGVETINHFLDETHKTPERYLMPLNEQTGEVEVIVVPDDTTREKLFDRTWFQLWLESCSEPLPYIRTLNELSEFEPHEP